jgi:hypothetical protein
MESFTEGCWAIVQDLVVTFEQQNTKSIGIICIRHTNKSIQQHCKAKFTSNEAYADFFRAWQSIVQSPTVPEYETRLPYSSLSLNIQQH